jgi:transcriptional regulator with XRE-family HTH domain
MTPLKKPGDLDTHVAEFVRLKRQQQGISQEQLASEADLHRTYVSLLERNKRHPTLAVFARLGSALGYDPDSFFLEFARFLSLKDQAQSEEQD